MIDQSEALRKLAQNISDPQMLAALQQALSAPSGQQAAQNITAAHADLLEQAAQSAQRGDYAQTARLAAKLMQTPEGRVLASNLRGLFGGYPK